MTRTHLLIIDPQIDFCDTNGALYIKGAEEDMIRLRDFIYEKYQKINKIFVTLDYHHKVDVAHPLFWWNKEGKNPKPFTIISSIDIKNNIWEPRNFFPNIKEKMLEYVCKLEEKGKLSLCIWPPHCLIGSIGQAVYPPLFSALFHWETEDRQVRYIRKGENIFTEHYSAFEAEVPDPADPGTELNKHLINEIWNADKVYVAGEAGSHCLKFTIENMVEYYEKNSKIIHNVEYVRRSKNPYPQKTILLEDTMSPVPGFENLQNEFLKEMKSKRMEVLKTTDIKD